MIEERLVGKFHIKGYCIEDFAGILRVEGYKTVITTPYSQGEEYKEVVRIVEVYEMVGDEK